MTRLRTVPLPSPAPPTEELQSHGSRHFRGRVRSGGSGACAAPLLPGWSFCSSRSSSRSPPPSSPRPGTSVWSREGSRRCLVLPGRPWCALAARSTSHGDGSSERALRAAGESGDGHDGPQLHPALPPGSPQGRRGLAPRACPKSLPQLQRSPRGPKPCSFPAHAAPGPPITTAGGLCLPPPRPPRLFSWLSLLASPALLSGPSGSLLILLSPPLSTALSSPFPTSLHSCPHQSRMLLFYYCPKLHTP